MIDEIRIAAESELELDSESDSCVYVWYDSDVEVMMMTMADGSGRVSGWAMLTMCSCFRRTVRSCPGGCTNDRPGESVREHSGMR